MAAYLTVGALRAALASLPDDLPVQVQGCDGCVYYADGTDVTGERLAARGIPNWTWWGVVVTRLVGKPDREWDPIAREERDVAGPFTGRPEP